MTEGRSGRPFRSQALGRVGIWDESDWTEARGAASPYHPEEIWTEIRAVVARHAGSPPRTWAGPGRQAALESAWLGSVDLLAAAALARHLAGCPRCWVGPPGRRPVDRLDRAMRGRPAGRVWSLVCLRVLSAAGVDTVAPARPGARFRA